MHQKNILSAGVPLAEAKKVLILIHGRGADARAILSLASHLEVADFALLAPEAENHTWYPHSFMLAPLQNEPWLSAALDLLKDIVEDLLARGVASEHIYFLGFSQGACLTLEFVARNARKYGGVIAFTGGLIGDRIYAENYTGDFKNSPIFIGTSDPDAHVPIARVHETTQILKGMHAYVTEKVYKGMGHTIIAEEISLANELIFHNKE